jgi:integrase
MTRNRRFQRGSLFKRGKRSKMWVARWWEDVIGTNGTLQRVRRSEALGLVADIPTRRQAETLMSDRLRAVNSGEFRLHTNRTLASYVKDCWLPEVLPTIKRSTQNHYQYVVNVHLLLALGTMQLRLITRDHVQSLLSSARSRVSWRTTKHIRTTLGTILEAAVMTGLIPDNPVRKTRLPRRGPIAEKAPIAPEKIRELLESLPEPSRSIASLLVFTGLRIGELLALRWRDIDLESGSIRVRQSVYEGVFDEPKTKRSLRTVPLSKAGISILAFYKRADSNPDALVFATRKGSPLSRRNLLNRQFKPTCERIGLVGANWHWLRHANATLLDTVGAPLGTVQALLGYSSAEITRDVYLHSVPADGKEAVQKVEDLIGPKWTQVSDFGKLATTLTQ